MHPLIIGGLISWTVNLSIGLFVFFNNPKKEVNRKLASFNLCIGFWSLGSFLLNTIPDKNNAFFVLRLSYIFAVLLLPTFLSFVYVLVQQKMSKRLILVGSLFSVFLISMLPTNWFIKGIYVLPKDGLLISSPGPVYFLFVVGFIISGYLGFSKLFSVIRSSSGVKRNQLIYISIAYFIATMAGLDYFMSVFRIFKGFPIDDYILIIPFSILAYAILRYRLLDIKVAVTRTGVFIAVYTLVLGLPFAVAIWLKGWLIVMLGAEWWMLPLVLMAVLATVGPFIYIYIESRAEERLLKEQRRYQETLKQASVGMTRIRNLKKLLDLIAHIVTKTVHISYAGIYLYNEEINEYVLQVSRDKGRMPIPKIASDNPLVSWMTQKHEPMIYDEIKMQLQHMFDITYQNLEENMRLLTASVIIPSFLEDKLIGFFVLGDKLSGQIYTPEDLNVFQVLASQAALAIENAQFYEETKEMQGQVAQAEKMATVGTMADGLSHQINNRFYALSLIAGDTIDTIKMTDTSKCTPEIKAMIEQINYALGRIQANVMQGGEVVKGILKYTRKGDEGLEEITLDQVLDGTLDMVQYKVKLSEIDFVRNYPKDTPKIKGNLVQLQEAFFNFIDNAYDSIVERRTFLKEPGYKGKITVSAIPKDSRLEIIVEDNGMGIKDLDSKKIFTPFFTTKTSSRKGTGLGLYVIRRIITDTHKGKIAFESAYKVGTRFIIELPIVT